jgi:hypothetical protein
MKKQFYQKVLPTQGVYCASGIRDGKVVNQFAESLDGLLEIVDRLEKDHLNVFVAFSTFQSYSRKADNAAFVRCFVLDLDVGTGPRKYASKNEAILDLFNFVEGQGLPPPVLIDSGTGVHAYWPFDSDVPAETWVRSAEQFKAFCSKHINIDPAVTADRARIMRVPGSLNYKTDPPIPSKLLTDEFWQYDFDLFKSFLDEVQPAQVNVLDVVQKGLDDDTSSVARIDPNFETVFEVLAQKSLDEEGGCAQIKYILENAATLPEPLWRSGLSLARACIDWEEAIHVMSAPYPNYSPEETIRKANGTVNREGKCMPHSCLVLDTENPGVCSGCPHWGRITNPLALGKRLKAPTEAPANAVRDDEDPQKVPVYTTFPKELAPFKRGPNGGIWYSPPAKQDKDGGWSHQPDIKIWDHDLYPIKRMYGPHDGECLMMRHIMPHDDVRDFLVPMAATYSMDKFKTIASQYGVLPKPAFMPLLAEYVIKWGEYMLNYRSAEQTRMQMGWTADGHGFVIGEQEIQRGGKTVKTAASPLVQSVSKLLRPAGDYDKWKEAAQKLNQPGFEMHAFALLCGLGSPLMPFTSTKGISVCYTGGSGNAKTGALYAGLSLFGDPVDLSLAGGKESATDNALVQWYMGLKNIMMGLDEASNRKPEEVSNLIYKVSQGKSKLRMQASVNAVREIDMTAALITFLTSNQSLTDKLTSFKHNPDGELARLLEFKIDRPQPMIDNPSIGKEIFDVFRLNYGHAGPRYIEHLLKVGNDYIHDQIKKWSLRFEASFGKDTAYRFYDSLVSVSFAAGELAGEADIIDYDLDRIYMAAMHEIVAAREGTNKINVVDYEEVLGLFQNRYHANVLILNEGRVVREPANGGLVGRIEVDKRMYYVAKRELKIFLASLQMSERSFVLHMEEKKLLVFKGKQRLTNGWPGMSTNAAIAVYGFKYDIPDEFFEAPG